MRFSDLILLALSALWQQKLRTTLTTLGVVFGSFVLLASLSVRDGVRERVVREHARFRELGEVHVYPGQSVVEEPPPEDLEIHGQMSDEKRRRLRDEIKRKWRWNHPSRAHVRLTEERLAELREIPHVRLVRPRLTLRNRAVLGEEAEYAVTISAVAGDERLAARIVAGNYLAADAARQVVVSEHLLYELGIADDADVAQAIGRKLRLEYHGHRPSPTFLVTLLSGYGANVAARHEDLLGKIVKRLPEAIAKIDLSPDERAAIQSLLQAPGKQKHRAATDVTAEFSICGVMRGLTDEETRGPWGWQEQNADLLLPVAAMAEFAFRTPELQQEGYEGAVVEVDDIGHVKAVAQEIEAMGLTANAFIAVIEREQVMYTLIFSAMTVVAVVGLLVAALGITNTTLMSVLERVREIGIMKAVGARNGHIHAIFLIEGTLIGLVGGTAGTVLAWAASFPADAWVQSMVQKEMSVELHGTIFAFPWWLLAGVPLFATAVTTAAAFLPARRAAGVNPVTALRHE